MVTSDDQNSARRFALFELSNNLINMGNNAFSSGYFAVSFVDTFFLSHFCHTGMLQQPSKNGAVENYMGQLNLRPRQSNFLLFIIIVNIMPNYTHRIGFTDSRRGRFLFSCSQKCKHICFGSTMSMGKSPVFFSCLLLGRIK